MIKLAKPRLLNISIFLAKLVKVLFLSVIISKMSQNILLRNVLRNLLIDFSILGATLIVCLMILRIHSFLLSKNCHIKRLKFMTCPENEVFQFSCFQIYIMMAVAFDLIFSKKILQTITVIRKGGGMGSKNCYDTIYEWPLRT